MTNGKDHIVFLVKQKQIEELQKTWALVSGRDIPLEAVYKELTESMVAIHHSLSIEDFVFPDLVPLQDDLFVLLFWDLFPRANEYGVTQLVVAGILIRYCALALDHVFDDDVSIVEYRAFTQYALLLKCEALKRLQSISGLTHRFWTEYSRVIVDFIHVAGLDGSQSMGGNQSWDFYETIGKWKSGIQELALFGMADIAGDKVPGDLLESLRNYTIGYQIYDDIRDLEKDLVKHNVVLPGIAELFGRNDVLECVSQNGKLHTLLVKARWYLERAVAFPVGGV